MNTDNTSGTTALIIQRLEATKKDIGQFLDDLSLENTDAQSRYENLKEELKASVREIRESLNRESFVSEEVAIALEVKLSAIDERLRRSDGNTADHARQFIRAIKSILKEVNLALGKDGSFNEFLERTHDQLQRLRLKFEIIKLRLALGTLKVKYAGEEMHHLLSQKVEALSSFIRESQDNAEEKLRKFRLMVKKIYSEIEKIF